MIRSALIALALCVPTTQAWAQSASGGQNESTIVAPAVVQAAPAPTRAKDRPDEVVCKQVPISGTRVMGPKTCMARREWKSMEGRGMEDVEAAIRAARTRNCAGC